MVSEYAGKPITCKAAVVWAPNTPLSIEQVEVAPPRANEVRIKIVATSLCHSDLSMINGTVGANQYPIIPGHEGAGIVESVGEGVTQFQPGDHVIPSILPNCGECVLCLNEKTNLCLLYATKWNLGVMTDGTSRFTCKGQSVYHFISVSSFSEYTVTSVHTITKINPEAPLNKVCLMSCCIPTAYGAVFKTAEVFEGARVAVFGCGALGLCAIQAAKKAKASRIIAVDVNSNKFVHAKDFGATDFINPRDHPDEPVEAVVGKMIPGGVDFSFEASGAGPAIMNSAFESVCQGWGKSVIISIIGEEQIIGTLPINFIKGKTWTSMLMGNVKRADFSKYVDMYMDGDLEVDGLITSTVPIENINQAIEDMKTGKAIRTVFTFA